MTAKHAIATVSRGAGVVASFHHIEPLGRSPYVQDVYATQSLPWVIRARNRRRNKVARASRKRNRG